MATVAGEGVEEEGEMGDTNQSELVSIEECTVHRLLATQCIQRPQMEALISPEEGIRMTYKVLNAEVEKLAAGLLSSGLAPGDHVGLWGGNHGFLLVFAMACARANLVFITINPAATAETLDHFIRWLELKCLIAFPTLKDQGNWNVLLTLCPELDRMASKGNMNTARFPKLTHVMWIDDQNAYAGAFSLIDVYSMAAAENLALIREIQKSVTGDTLLTIQLTTGTTGEPKAVRLSHYQFLNAGQIVGRRIYLDAQGESLCCTMPLWRSGVMSVVMGSMLTFGGKIYLPSPSPLPSPIFTCLQNQKCTTLLSHPIAFHLMMRLPYAKKFDLSSLTSVCLIGDHLPADLIPILQRTTNVTDITVGVMLTEVACLPIFFPSDGLGEKLLTKMGTVAPHFQVKIGSFADGKEASRGKTGEIYVRPLAGTQFLGYFKNKAVTEESYKNGWVKTGDVGTMDDNGYVEVLGQRSDIMTQKSNGHKIYPWPMEKKMTAHPLIVAVQVVQSNDKIVAFAIVKDKQLPEDKKPQLKKDLIQMCREENFVEPDAVDFVPDFPRSATRRVQKFKLREIVSKM